MEINKKNIKKYEAGSIPHDLFIKYCDQFATDMTEVVLKNFMEYVENNYTKEELETFKPAEAIAVLITLINDFVELLKKEFGICKVIKYEKK